ncbi:hypothetical protein CLIB1423_06S03928 [[Candida] railenensis]|uniref:Uncharacterized protein n=1 Tax=[Candida] railenensis TaxID=45579 RepID=A0A9P0VYA9_9ASCO|nr:hypothetical protein CLIB1423_06S03928 [[Candida] railenensis]
MPVTEYHGEDAPKAPLIHSTENPEPPPSVPESISTAVHMKEKLEKCTSSGSDEFIFTPTNYSDFETEQSQSTSPFQNDKDKLFNTIVEHQQQQKNKQELEDKEKQENLEDHDPAMSDSKSSLNPPWLRGSGSSGPGLRINKIPSKGLNHLDKHIPPDSWRRTSTIPRFSNSYLKPNAKFVGEQLSDSSRYYIEVQFKTVDMVNSLVTGFLEITGLTPAPTNITTYFKGEIINNPLNKYDWKSPENSLTDDTIQKFSFATENRQWESSIKNDFDHWEILTQMRDSADCQIRNKLNQIQSQHHRVTGNSSNSDQFIYMRWKEEFLVPDSRVEKIFGASYDGFYFIVLNIGDGISGNGGGSFSTGASNSKPSPGPANSSHQYHHESKGGDSKNSLGAPGSISGLYYHKSFEMFQSLSLGFVNDHGTRSNFEFC